MSVNPAPQPSRDRISGLAIAVGLLLAVLMMTHHPTVESRGMSAHLEEIRHEAGLNRFVHGAMIGLMSLTLFGFSGLTLRLGWERSSNRGGFMAYTLGILAMIVAALVSGFVYPDLAFRYQGASAEEVTALEPTLRMAWAVNQNCTKLGVVGMSLGIALWSVALLGRGGALRVLGGVGLLAGAVPIVGLMAGHLSMSVHGMEVFLLVQTIWSLAIAGMLVRGRL